MGAPPFFFRATGRNFLIDSGAVQSHLARVEGRSMSKRAVLSAVPFAMAMLLPAATVPGRMPPGRMPSPQENPDDAAELVEDTPGPDQLDAQPAQVEGGVEGQWIESGNPENIPLLIHYLRGQEEVAQSMALVEFAGMSAKARPAAHAVLDALHDSKGSIRVEAATTLIHLHCGTDAAVRELTEELEAEDATDRVRAAEAIGQLVAPPLDYGASDWGPDPPPRIARPWVGKRTLPALVEALGDREPRVRIQAAQTLGLIGRGGKPAVPALTKALHDNDAAVRASASQALISVETALRAKERAN